MDLIEKQCSKLKGPYHFGLDITNKCNYRCLHCYNSSGDNNSLSNEMSDAEVLDVVRDLASVKPCGFCFCGGEPLLRLELLLKCCDILYENGIHNIAIVSNGYYFTEEVAKKLKQHHVNNVQISLDGADKYTCYDLRRNELSFEKAINALRILSTEDFFTTSVSFCPTKNNVKQFEAVYNICENLKVKKLRVQPLMAIGRANKNLLKIMPSNMQYVELLRQIKKLNLKRGKTEIEYGDPLEHIFKAKERNLNLSALSLNIKNDGSIVASSYLPITVGNLKRHSIKEYWDAKLYNVWSLGIVKKLADHVTSVNDMGKHEEQNIETWIDKNIELDIVDDKTFNAFDGI